MFRWTAGTRTRAARAARQNFALPPAFHTQKTTRLSEISKPEECLSMTFPPICEENSQGDSSNPVAIGNDCSEPQISSVKSPTQALASSPDLVDAHREGFDNTNSREDCRVQTDTKNGHITASIVTDHEGLKGKGDGHECANGYAPLLLLSETNAAETASKMDSVPFISSDLTLASSAARAQARLLLHALAKSSPDGGDIIDNNKDGGTRARSASMEGGTYDEDPRHRRRGCRRTYTEERAERERRLRARRSNAFEDNEAQRKPYRACQNRHEEELFSALAGASSVAGREAGGVDFLALRWPLWRGGARDFENHFRTTLAVPTSDKASPPAFIEGHMVSELSALGRPSSSPSALGYDGGAGLSVQAVLPPPSTPVVGAGNDSRYDPQPYSGGVHVADDDDSCGPVDGHCVELLPPVLPTAGSANELNSRYWQVSMGDGGFSLDALDKPLPPLPLLSLPPLSLPASPIALFDPSAKPQEESEGVWQTLSAPGELHDCRMCFDSHRSDLPGGGGVASAVFAMQPRCAISSPVSPRLIWCPEDDCLPPRPEDLYASPNHSVHRERSSQASAPVQLLKSSMTAPFRYPVWKATCLGPRTFKEDVPPYDDRIQAAFAGQRSPGETLPLFSDPSIVQIPPRLAPLGSFLEELSPSCHHSLNPNSLYPPFSSALQCAGFHNGGIGAQVVQGPTTSPMRSCRRPYFEGSYREVLPPPRAELSSCLSSAYGNSVGARQRTLTAPFARQVPLVKDSTRETGRTGLWGRGGGSAAPKGLRPMGTHSVSRRQQFRDRCQRTA